MHYTLCGNASLEGQISSIYCLLQTYSGKSACVRNSHLGKGSANPLKERRGCREWNICEWPKRKSCFCIPSFPPGEVEGERHKCTKRRIYGRRRKGGGRGGGSKQEKPLLFMIYPGGATPPPPPPPPPPEKQSKAAVTMGKRGALLGGGGGRGGPFSRGRKTKILRGRRRNGRDGERRKWKGKKKKRVSRDVLYCSTIHTAAGK